MSDIWHKAGFHEAIDDKLKVSKDGKWVHWTMYGWNIPGKDGHDIGCEWAYLDDILALEGKLEHTRKELEQSKICCTEWEKQALDYKAENISLSGKLKIAVDALKLFYSGQFTLQPDSYGIKKDASYSAQIALAEMTELEQKDK